MVVGGGGQKYKNQHVFLSFFSSGGWWVKPLIENSVIFFNPSLKNSDFKIGDKLKEAIKKDRENGLIPFYVRYIFIYE